MPVQNVPQIYIQLKDWQDKHEQNALATNNLINSYNTQYQNGDITQDEYNTSVNSVWDVYTDKCSELGYGFDFLEGNDPNDTASYQAQLAKLASGEMSAKDKNADGKITRDEYVLAETYGGSTVLTNEEKVQAAMSAHMAFDAINSLVLTDSNPDNDDIDDNLSLDDLQNFYKALDGFNYDYDKQQNTFDGNFNGEIDLDSFQTFMDTATASVTEEDKKKLEDYYTNVFNLASVIKFTKE